MVIMEQQCARYRFSVDKKEPTMGIMLSLLVVDLKGNKSWPSLNAEHTLSSSHSSGEKTFRHTLNYTYRYSHNKVNLSSVANAFEIVFR